MDMPDDFMTPRRPTADRPLLGQTILMVEDSRFAGETMRLMCLRGGARIRRADSLRAARRHLRSYRPSIVLVDPGLPDGSGLELIAGLASQSPRMAALLVVSGDPMMEEPAHAVGADGFLTKPFGSVAAFHAAILDALPSESRPLGPRIVDQDVLAASDEALLDDFALIAHLLGGERDPSEVSYALGFAASLGRSAGDSQLVEVAERAARAFVRRRDMQAGGDLADLAALVSARLGPAAVAI